MNRQLFTHAKSQIKTIHEASKHISPGNNLMFHETTIGFELSQVFTEWVFYLSGINFGRHKLTRKQVKQIIQDNEQLEYL